MRSLSITNCPRYSVSTLETVFIQVELEIMRRKKITRWVCMPNLLSLKFYRNVPEVLLWGADLRPLRCSLLLSGWPIDPSHLSQPIILDDIFQVIIYLFVNIHTPQIINGHNHIFPWDNIGFNILYQKKFETKATCDFESKGGFSSRNSFFHHFCH